jgi:hypothetical protein
MRRSVPIALFFLCLAPAAAAAQARAAFPENGPFTEPPQLLNRDEVAQLAKASYPEQVKAEGAEPKCGSAGVRECGSAGVRECGSAGVRVIR